MNGRIGTRYLAELIRMFEGKSHFAIASYNAGENRVAVWRRDKPDLEPEEFIDDIPFPETQNYVKRILGTAEDYRRLYGSGMSPAPVNRALPGKSLGKPPPWCRRCKSSAKKATDQRTVATKKKPAATRSDRREEIRPAR